MAPKREQGRVDVSRVEKGGRDQNYHVPSKDREGDRTSGSTTVAYVLITVPSPQALIAGQTEQASATTYNAQAVALTAHVTGWESSNSSVATVNGNGLITAVSVGTAVIRAIYNSLISNPITVTVTPAPFDAVPSSILVNPATAAVNKSSTVTLQGIVKNAEAAVIPAAVPDAWHTSDATVATVSSAGVVTGVGVGTCNITATITSPSITSNTCAVTVSDPVPSAIAITPTSQTVHAGATQQMIAVVTNAESAVLSTPVSAWHSSDTSKATVNAGGLVTGVAAGSVTITATITSPSITSNNATITVDVPVDNTPASIAIAPTSATVSAGQTVQLAATVKNAAGGTVNQQPDAWHTSDATKATVSSTGVVTAVAQGSANITATITSPSLTSNTSAITVPAVTNNDEPVYGSDPTDSLIVQENFDSYSTVADFNAQATGSGVHLGALGDDQANFSLVTDRNGGKALRIPYTNVTPSGGWPSGQEINKIQTYRNGHAFDQDGQNPIDDLTYGKTIIIQDWRRIIVNGTGIGVSDDIALKWMEFIYSGNDANRRQMFDSSNHGTYPGVWPSGAIWQTLGDGDTLDANGNTFNAKQCFAPTIGQLAAAGTWFKSTFMWRGHTSPTQKDGFARMWVNGVEIIRCRQDAVGVRPPGGVNDGYVAGLTKPWCIQQDVDNIGIGGGGTYTIRSISAFVWYHQLIAFTGHNFDGGTSGFTIDTDDIKCWVRN